MNNQDLGAILNAAAVEPRLLPHMLLIYKIGKIAGINLEKDRQEKLIREKLSEVL